MITDTCICHTRLDTYARTRYLYEHELGYSMEYYHAIGTRGGPTARSRMHWVLPAPTLHRHIKSTCYRTGTAHISHEVRAGSTDAQRVLDTVTIKLSGIRQPKSTDTSGKYDLGTAVTNAVLYTIDTEIHTK